MKKIAIFNVGGAFSAYIEINDVKFIIDLGGGNNFSPTNDFLLPLAVKRKFSIDELNGNKYTINQLFLSHLDNDHISDYDNFMSYFSPQFITAPNDNDKQNPKIKVNRNKLPESEIARRILDKMKYLTPGRGDMDPEGYDKPLITCLPSNVFLSYILPSECEKIDNLSNSEYSNYANNISLLVYINFGNSNILFTGDIMSDGMKYLIDNDTVFYNNLVNNGVDFFITPHHGLDTSFSSDFYNIIKNNKVGLNIISEKSIQKTNSDNRHNVDRRYYSSNFSHGKNVLNGNPGIQYGIITSRGHIVIDFEGINPIIKRCNTNEDLLKEFL